MKHQAASVISALFEPMTVLGVTCLVGGWHAGLRAGGFSAYAAIIILGMMLPIALLRVWLVRIRAVGNWDMTDRKERIKPLAALCAIAIVDGLVVTRFGVPEINRLFALFVVWLLGFLLVTMRWKISGHAGVSAAFAGLVVWWFGIGWSPALLLPVIVGWSRVVRRDHTPAQVIAGTAYSWLLILVFARLPFPG